MSKLNKIVTETPDIGPLRKLFGKTLEWGELIAIIVVALFVASALGLGG